MVYFNYFIFSLFISFSSCANGHSATDKLAIMDLVSEISDSYSDGRIEKQVTKHKIGYYEDYVLYKIGTIIFSVKTTQANGNIHNEARQTNDTSYKYFIIKKDRNIGIVYDSLRAGNKQHFKLDSLKIDLGINSENLEVYGVPLGIPSRVKKNAKSNKIEFEEYQSKKLKNDADTIFRFYDDKLKKFDFSFSPLLDKEKGTKLVKSHFIYLYGKKTNSKIAYKTRTDFVDFIEEVKVNYSEDLINLFERFKEDNKNLKF